MPDPTGGAAAPWVSDMLRPTASVTSGPNIASARFDLDTIFIVQKGNLAVLHEAQALLADAVHSMARTQQAYFEQLQRSFSPLDAVGQGIAMARDVYGLAAEVSQRVGALLSRGVRLNLEG